MTPAEQAVQAALAKAADYVEATQPLLDKQAAERNNYLSEVSQAVTKLADIRAIDPSKKDALRDKLASDPVECARFLVALAEKSAAPQGLGSPQEVQPSSATHGYSANGRPLSASDRAVLYGDPNVEGDTMHTGHI